VPETVIESLLVTIFQIKQVIEVVLAVVGITTFLAIGLVLFLSLRLREKEIDTVFRLGGSRSTVSRLVFAELFIVFVFSSVLCALLIVITAAYSQEWVLYFMVD
jgi:putative ABC transport system permease protein